MKKILFLTLIILFVTSCTDNQRARKFGGDEIIKLQKNEVFLNITWKQDDIWIIVKDTCTNFIYAREKSSYGLMEGRIIVESDNQTFTNTTASPIINSKADSSYFSKVVNELNKFF